MFLLFLLFIYFSVFYDQFETDNRLKFAFISNSEKTHNVVHIYSFFLTICLIVLRRKKRRRLQLTGVSY